jgi:glutathione S-transferase
MPNAEVPRKWERVFARGYGDAELAKARGKRARVVEKLEAHLVRGGPWLLGEDYSLADIKWYSMVPGLPRLVPGIRGARTLQPGAGRQSGVRSFRQAISRHSVSFVQQSGINLRK